MPYLFFTICRNDCHVKVYSHFVFTDGVWCISVLQEVHGQGQDDSVQGGAPESVPPDRLPHVPPARVGPHVLFAFRCYSRMLAGQGQKARTRLLYVCPHRGIRGKGEKLSVKHLLPICRREHFENTNNSIWAAVFLHETSTALLHTEVQSDDLVEKS